MAGRSPTPDELLAAPKVLLHDHLDGGLRPETVIELADETGYAGLPTTNAAELAEWMKRGADRKDLVLYLDTFAHTTGVMQTPDSLHRVARECAEDLAADGGVYAEVRFAPELHTEQALTMDDVVEAVTAGFEAGSADTALTIRTICSAMRQNENSLAVSELAVRWRDRGVIGFDIAGPENGFPPDDHMPAFQLAQRENFHFTIHAGEAYGPKSIWKALQWCGAERLGHGVRIIDDISIDGDGQAHLGRTRGLHPGSPSSPRVVPIVEPAHGRGGRSCRSPDPAVQGLEVPGHLEHGQPADERYFDDQGNAEHGRCLWLGSARHAVDFRERNEERVLAVRRTAGADQQRDQTQVRHASRRLTRPVRWTVSCLRVLLPQSRHD